MDDRFLEWLHLLPADAAFAVTKAPEACRALLQDRVSNSADSYFGWGVGLSDLPDLTPYESVVLVNPHRIGPSTLRAAGFRDTSEYVAFPSLSNPRWLLPLDSAQLTLAAARLVAPWPSSDLKRARLVPWLARLGLLRHVGGRLILGRRRPSDLEVGLKQLLGVPHVRLALKIGPRRSVRKTTVQVMAEDGQILAFAKLAGSRDAEARLDREMGCLQDFAHHRALVGQVPRLIGAFRTAGCLVSVQTAGPSERGPLRLGQQHQEFLAAMASATGGTVRFDQSDLFHNLSTTFQTRVPQFSPVWRARLDLAWSQFVAPLAAADLPVSTAHRDFLPENTSLRPDGRLFVFDWEWGQPESLLPYDFFHFQFLAHTTQRTPPVEAFSRILQATRVWYPELPVTMLAPSFIVYLIDQATHRLFNSADPQWQGKSTLAIKIAAMLDSSSRWAFDRAD